MDEIEEMRNTMNSFNTLLDNKTVLITGGTGSFGHAFVDRLLSLSSTVTIIIYSRDEYKQYLMTQEYQIYKNSKRLRFVIGDVRNRDTLVNACRGVDYIIHAAALKQVPTCEDNIQEAILTNINGALNVKYAAEANNIKKIVALSTDKAVQPINLYGATKMVSDKVFTDTSEETSMVSCIVRYGNVVSSRGSVIPFFMKRYKEGLHDYPITDIRMTRFWISLEEAVQMALIALKDAVGGETFVAKLPSFFITDLVKAIDPDGQIDIVGIRPGEKIDELMITKFDAEKTVDFGKYYVIYPTVKLAKSAGYPLVDREFEYSSNKNDCWLDIDEIKTLLMKWK